MVRSLIKLCNGFVSLLIGLTLLLGGAYAGYCLWDNSRVYAAAENVQAELLLLKPKAVDPEDKSDPDFAELIAFNRDVRGWVSMEGTKIDHPILQGETNMDYINTDVYGNFALAGSIFLDSRNDPGFQDPYSLLYGHHMENSAMFGDLDLYLNEEFFHEHKLGELLLPGESFALEVVCSIKTRAGEDRIFDPTLWKRDIAGLLDFAQDESLYCHSTVLNTLRERYAQGELPQILALSTCSSEFTDARTVVLTVMLPYKP